MMTKLTKNLSLLFILFAGLLFAQEKEISGTVTGPDGPIPDVTVTSSGGGSAVTDFDGNFTITASEGDVLSFDGGTSGFGTSTVTVGASNSYNVSLSAASGGTALDELVVTGLGISREKKALGYSIQEVDGDLAGAARPNNALGSLSGNVAGVQISQSSSNLGGSTRILIRGAGSVSGENRPLIVVDGIPISNNNFNPYETERGGGGRDYGDATFDINPDDIETYSVLKGGPASAIYGSRGSNGVILITTKKGKKGTTKFEVNTGVSFDRIYIYPDLQREYGGGFGDFVTQNINGTDFELVDYATDESWGPKYDPNRLVLHWDAFDPEFANDYLTPRPWVAPENDVDSFFDTGITYNNSVGISTSFQDTNLRFSLGHIHSEGIVPNSWLERTNFGLNWNSKLRDNLIFEGGANYNVTTGFNRPEVGYGDNSVAQKFFQWGQRQLDYDRLKNYKTSTGQQRTWNRISWDNPVPNYSDNPYWTINENISHDKRRRFFGNAGLTYLFKNVEGLSATGRFFYDTYNWGIDERVAIGSQATSSYTEHSRGFEEYNLEFRANYERKFGKIDIFSFVGVNRRDENAHRLSGTTNGGLVIPGLYNLSNSTDPATATNFSSEKRVNSVFGLLSLGYMNAFFVQFTGRNDWSSALPEGSNSYFYPSVTGSIVFSEFFKPSFLNFGKIRAGWAQVDNDTGPYSLNNTWDVRNPFLGSPQYSYPNSSLNPNLVPEEKTTVEFGIELSLFNRRVNIDATYYDEETKNLITTAPATAATGFLSAVGNVGTMSNKGIELTVNLIPVRNDDFQWSIDWNFAKNKNTLESLNSGQTTLQLASIFTARLYAVVGETYGQIYGTDFIYDDNGNKVVDAGGRYVSSNIRPLGSILPDYNMGIRNSFQYKNFRLSGLIDIQKGGKYFSISHMWGMYSGMITRTTDNNVREDGIILDGVTGDVSFNPETGEYTVTNTAPNETAISAVRWGADHYSRVAAQNVFDADYIKLRELTLSYTFGEKLRGPFDGVVISAFARNLFAWNLAWDGMDPEQAGYSSGNIRGIEGGSLPSVRTYGLNVNLTF